MTCQASPQEKIKKSFQSRKKALVHFKVYPTLCLDRIGAIKGISDLVFGQNWCSVLLKVYPTCRQTNWCK